ncbi:MAG: lectin-like protein [Planctomycetota bacterium]|jgi:subtilisin-like proprotein convertase family protein
MFTRPKQLRSWLTSLALLMGVCTEVLFAGELTSPIVREGHTYFLIAPRDWVAAEKYAVSLGGHLATINDEAENNFLFAELGASEPWIGLNDRDNEGTFVWSSGEPVEFTDWSPGEPNDSNGNEDAVRFFSTGQWNDLNETGIRAAIVELPFVDCNGNGVDDTTDIADETSADCNGNGTPDECELADHDCNLNEVFDACEFGGQLDFSMTMDPPLTVNNSAPPATHTLVVPDSGTVYDVNVGLTMTHTWVSDVVITVSHGDTSVTLFSNQCGNENNFTGTVWDDEADGPITCSSGHEGTFLPFSPLSAFDGMEASGDWIMTVEDTQGGDHGTWNAWTLSIGIAGTSTDCNENSVPDSCDINAGGSLDCNATAVPDDCESMAGGNFDAGGTVALDDHQALVNCLAGPEVTPDPTVAECASACLEAFDFGSDGDVDLADLKAFQNVFAP